MYGVGNGHMPIADSVHSGEPSSSPAEAPSRPHCLEPIGDMLPKPKESAGATFSAALCFSCLAFLLVFEPARPL